jgi:tetratricopeptide (TPR) repeat protein
MKESVVGSQMGSLMALLPGLKDGQSKRLCGYNRRQRRYLAGELARLPVPVSAIRANLANFLNAPDWFFGRGGNWMDKIAALKEILALDPNNSFARYGLAMERVGRGETDEALSEFDALLAIDANYTAAYFMAAQTLARAGRKPEAIERLKDGIKSAAQSGNAHAMNEMQAMLDDLEH